MNTKNNQLDFTNQAFYIGIDVHKKSWKVSIRTNKIHLKTFSMDPSEEGLSRYMQKHYPKGNYYSAYEAGFSGFSTHRKLNALGIKNIVVSPNLIPTNSKERINKTDKRDSIKISRELENGNLKGIYVPSVKEEALRSLTRMRKQLVNKQSRIKNQIKSYLYYNGKNIPMDDKSRNWSNKFIEALRKISFEDSLSKEVLERYIDELLYIKERISSTKRKIREEIKNRGLSEDLALAMSVPGIGFITASTFLAEIMDIRRFKNKDSLSSFVGLVPSVRSSSDREKVLGISIIHNKYLRTLLIESAWIAVREDPALTMAYNKYIKRMEKTKAIIRIARKLLNRLDYVLKNRTEYVVGVIE